MGDEEVLEAVGPPNCKATRATSEWMYVLAAQLRLRLGELDLVMKAGEAAEFDTHIPHWFGSAGPRPAELLVLFGPQGERLHVRARALGKS